MTDCRPKDRQSLLGQISPSKNRKRRKQFGALPYRFTTSGSLELLLVTTRQTRRWTIPKGWPVKKLKPRESAAREAYEEAGVLGTTDEKSIGWFTYDKMLDAEGRSVSCKVSVYPLRVEAQLETWPESHERQSVWFDPHSAASAVTEVGLRHLIKLLVDRIDEPATE
jgi:8-oxo-dGTP pyrophosphatase MutT (NUDIX family)